MDKVEWRRARFVQCSSRRGGGDESRRSSAKPERGSKRRIASRSPADRRKVALCRSGHQASYRRRRSRQTKPRTEFSPPALQILAPSDHPVSRLVGATCPSAGSPRSSDRSPLVGRCMMSHEHHRPQMDDQPLGGLQVRSRFVPEGPAKAEREDALDDDHAPLSAQPGPEDGGEERPNRRAPRFPPTFALRLEGQYKAGEIIEHPDFPGRGKSRTPAALASSASPAGQARQAGLETESRPFVWPMRGPPRAFALIAGRQPDHLAPSRSEIPTEDPRPSLGGLGPHT